MGLEKNLENYWRRLVTNDPHASRSGAWNKAFEAMAERLIARRETNLERQFGKEELDLGDLEYVTKNAGLDALMPHEKMAFIKQAEAMAQAVLFNWTARREQTRREQEQQLSMAERASAYAELTQSPADIEVARQLLEQAKAAHQPEQAALPAQTQNAAAPVEPSPAAPPATTT